MARRDRKNLKLYFINNLTENLKNKVNSKKSIFITSNLVVYSKFKNFSNFYFLHDYITNNEVRNFYLKNIKDWHSMLYEIDIKLNKEIYGKRIKKKNNIFIASYIFRYFAFQEFCSLMCTLFGIKKFFKKKNFDQIEFIGFNDLRYFNLNFVRLFFKNNLKQSIIIEDIDKKDKFLYIKKYIFKKKENIINKKNILFSLKFLKKFFLNQLNKFSKKQNSLYLTHNKELLYDENILYRNYKNFFLKRTPKLNYGIKSLKRFKFKNISKNFTDYLIRETIDIFNTNFPKINDLKEQLIKYKIRDIRYDIEDTNIKNYIAIYIANLLKLDVVGYQHGSDYCGTSKRDLDHDYLSYKFCDKFKIWGHSKFFKKNKFNILKKKINFIKTGSLSGKFSNEIFNFAINKKNSKILYVPSTVRSNYTIAKSVQDPLRQYTIQKKIINFLGKYSKKNSFISLPILDSNYSFNNFPLNYYSKINELNKLYGSFKNNLLKLKPKTILFDNFSTPVFESVPTNCKIIIFMDPLNLPEIDVLNKLKKRAYIINNLDNFETKLINVFEKKILKNKEFQKSFYFK